MRPSSLLLALPVLACAQQQIPLFEQVKGWFARAGDTISSAIPSAPSVNSIPNPIAAGAKKIASLKVQRVTLDNHRDVLKPGAATASPGLEEWMLLVTGGNKTCYGLCERAETEFNKSVPLLAASARAPHLALLDCESDGVLCHAWAVSPPTIMHMFLPQPLPDQSTPATTVRFIALNRTAVAAPDLAAIHTRELYKEHEPYDGFWHPFDGVLAKNGLSVPVGYAVWAFSKVPSWAFMILISFASRNIMGRRLGGQGAGAAPPAAAAAPAPAS